MRTAILISRVILHYPRWRLCIFYPFTQYYSYLLALYRCLPLQYFCCFCFQILYR